MDEEFFNVSLSVSPRMRPIDQKPLSFIHCQHGRDEQWPSRRLGNGRSRSNDCPGAELALSHEKVGAEPGFSLNPN